mmetsp:Transcript_79992/g.166334  ORF Transcript_79992/g.166334 Transcript_79992/m.166334 type:complete len:437 (+) Transcript_79992:1674-2984(+)
MPDVLAALLARHVQEAGVLLLLQDLQLLHRDQSRTEGADELLRDDVLALARGVALHVIGVQLVDLAALQGREALPAIGQQVLGIQVALVPGDGRLEAGPLLVGLHLEVLEGLVLHAQLGVQLLVAGVAPHGADHPLRDGAAHELCQILLLRGEERLEELLRRIRDLVHARDQVRDVGLPVLGPLPAPREDGQIGGLGDAGRLRLLLLREAVLVVPGHLQNLLGGDLQGAVPVLGDPVHLVLVADEVPLLNGLLDVLAAVLGEAELPQSPDAHAIHEHPAVVSLELCWGVGLVQCPLPVEDTVLPSLHLVVDDGGQGVEEPLVHLLELLHDLLLHDVGHLRELAGGGLPELDHALQLVRSLLGVVPAVAADVVLVRQDVGAPRTAVQLAGHTLSEADHEAVLGSGGVLGGGLEVAWLADEGVEGEAGLPVRKVLLEA